MQHLRTVACRWIKAHTETLCESDLPPAEQTKTKTVKSHLSDFEYSPFQKQLLEDYHDTQGAFVKHGPHRINIHKQSLRTALAKQDVDLPTTSGNTDPASPNASMELYENGTIGVRAFNQEPGWKTDGTGSYYIIEPPLDLEPVGPRENPSSSITKLLLDIDSEHDHYQTEGETPVIVLNRNGQRLVLTLPSDRYSNILADILYERHGKIPSDGDLKKALRIIQERCFRSPYRSVCKRIGHHDDNVYWDIGDDTYDAIEISRDGWRVVPGESVPVLFKRSVLMTPLSRPERGGSGSRSSPADEPR